MAARLQYTTYPDVSVGRREAAAPQFRHDATTTVTSGMNLTPKAIALDAAGDIIVTALNAGSFTPGEAWRVDKDTGIRTLLPSSDWLIRNPVGVTVTP